MQLTSEQLFEGSAVYELRSDGTLQLIFLSPQAAALLKLPEVPQLPCALSLLGLSPEDELRYRSKLQEALVSRRSFTMVQQCMPADNDEPFYREIKVIPLNREASSQLYLLELSHDVTAVSRSLMELREYNVRLELALSQTAQKLWEIDLKSKTFALFDPKLGTLGGHACQLALNDDWLGQWVHESSAAQLRLFLRRLMAGQKVGSGAFIMRSGPEQPYAWYSLYYRMLFAADGSPERALGVITPLEQLTTLPLHTMATRLWEKLLPKLYSYVCVNLSTGRVEQLWYAGRSLTLQPLYADYAGFLRGALKHVFAPNERNNLEKAFARDNLQELQAKGHHWLSFNFKIVENQSYVRSIKACTLLERIPEVGTLYAFVFMQYLDELTSACGALLKADRPELASGVYDWHSMRHTFAGLIQQSKGAGAYAVIKCVHLPHAEVQSALDYIGGALSLYFASSGLLGRLHDTCFSLLLPGNVNVIKARREIEEAFHFVRGMLSQQSFSGVRFVSAMCCGHLSVEAFDEFNRAAVLCCARLEQRGTDCIELLPTAYELNAKQEEHLLFADAAAALPVAASQAVLSATENALLLDLLDLQIKIDDPSAALNQIIMRLGHFYGCDRVYTLRLISNGREIEEMYEWDAQNCPSFKGLLSGLSIARMPLLRRAIDSRRTCYVAERERSLNLKGSAIRHEMWSFAAVPFFNTKSELSGVICFDNPFKSGGNFTLAERLKPYLAQLHQKIVQMRANFIGSGEPGEGIYPLPVFNQQIEQMTDSSYSSLGVFAVSVPQLLQLSYQHGYQHCAQLLQTLSDLLRRFFGSYLIFHTLDSEFLVLVTNTTKELFFDRAKRCEELCRRSCHAYLLTAATWARGRFSGNELVQEVRTMMLRGKEPSAASLYPAPALPYVDAERLLKQFTVCYQPKVDLETKEVIGAEALVRGLSADGSLISPVNFISRMEREGTLRDLDLFVLSSVLQRQQRWKQQGYRLVPVSVNFSRFTLFDHSTAGAVLAILSHYAQNAADQIEIEITETACKVAEATLLRALQPYRDIGMKFALDDFGAGYANLSLFSKVQFDCIKLDCSLIADLPENKVGQSLLESIVRISNEQHMQVIAEGVEQRQQEQILRRAGCRYAQGFLYDKAIEPELFAAKYLKQVPSTAARA